MSDRAARFAVSRAAYLAVGMLALCVTVLVRTPVMAVVYVIPLLAGLYVARTATVVDTDGITLNAIFGSRTLPWLEIRGISVTGKSLYAVTDDGAYRLPAVQVAQLAELSQASAGHVPDLIEAAPKYAPQPRRR